MILEYIVAIASAVILDGLWLGVVSKPIYEKYIGDLMVKQVHLIPAILFYLIFGVAILVFVANPALKNSWGFGNILFHGALLGLVVYGGYDLTNLALIKGWPVVISIIDIAWGVTLASAVSLITVYLSKLWIK